MIEDLDLYWPLLESLNLDAITTVELADQAWNWLGARIEWVERERDDELTLAVEARDADWLRETKSLLRRARALRQEVQNRRGALTRKAQQARAAQAERVFVEVARARLAPQVWNDIWEEAYRLRPDLHPDGARAA